MEEMVKSQKLQVEVSGFQAVVWSPVVAQEILLAVDLATRRTPEGI